MLAPLLLVCGLTVQAQDVMIMKDGEEVLAKVEEITPDLVKYKLFSNLEGPLISVERSKVFMIKYENGSKQVLAEEEPPKPEEPASTPTVTSPTVTYSRVKFQRKRQDSEIYNLIKVNTMAILVGDLPLYYERRLGDQISVEAGLGLTYSYDLLDRLFGLTSESYEGRSPRLGYSARAAFHFFPDKYVAAPENWYFGPEIQLRHYGSSLVSCGSAQNLTPVNEHRNLLDLKVTGGYIAFASNSVFFEFYGGLGMRYKSLYYASCDYTGPVTIIQQPNRTGSWGPTISMGIKFGFGF